MTMHEDARCGLNVFMAGAMTVLVAIPVGIALGFRGWRMIRDAVR